MEGKREKRKLGAGERGKGKSSHILYLIAKKKEAF